MNAQHVCLYGFTCWIITLSSNRQDVLNATGALDRFVVDWRVRARKKLLLVHGRGYWTEWIAPSAELVPIARELVAAGAKDSGYQASQ